MFDSLTHTIAPKNQETDFPTNNDTHENLVQLPTDMSVILPFAGNLFFYRFRLNTNPAFSILPYKRRY